MVCDILAGEQGPSCGTVKQIPNTKLIHVRFIDETEVEIEGKCDDNQSDSEDTGLKKTLSHLEAQVKRGKKWRTLIRKLFPRASSYQPHSTWVVLLNLAPPWLT